MKRTLACAVISALGLPVLAGSASRAQAPAAGPGQMPDRARELLAERRQRDALVWGPEILAQAYESTFVSLWDELLRRDDKFDVLASVPFTTLSLGGRVSRETLDHQIRRTRFGDPEKLLSPSDWRKLLAAFRADGYEIVQTEWHNERFEPAAGHRAARTEVAVVLHVARAEPAHRVILRALLDVRWSTRLDSAGNPIPDTLRVRDLEILERSKPAIFREIFRVASSQKYPRILPLLVQDLNGDGLSEVVLGGANMVLRNRGAGRFEVDRFLEDERSVYDAAVLADFTGDGVIDYVAVDTEGYPLLFRGASDGRFTARGHRIADTHLALPKAFTAGDIDADGDLDLFIANYKYAYRGGQMPTPYYDANDGYPAYLLRNDGDGKFADITAASGLAPKRFRRTYSSSLVDLDDDSDMDLIVVSDYAGLDVYQNDGRGHFEDVSERMGGDRHFFGMGHTFADYDLDGSLDLYVIGMSSTTARRLERLGLGRLDKPEHDALRSKMGYGNRMFLRRPGQFVEAPFNDRVARTGWSWGASSFDFDNDGDADIFVANGHYSGRSTEDYCSTFWRHDIYTEGSEPSRERDWMFQVDSKELREAQISWNGYEHKVLLMNDRGEDFVDVAFLMGAAFEFDGRAVVTDDLDADGRVDMLVVEFKTQGRDQNQYILHVYQNVMEDAGHWIGVRLQNHGPGVSPIGASVTVTTPSGSQSARVVTGDSFSSQHPSVVHFGLAGETKVGRIEVRWPNGSISRIENPEADRYHSLSPE